MSCCSCCSTRRVQTRRGAAARGCMQCGGRVPLHANARVHTWLLPLHLLEQLRSCTGTREGVSALHGCTRDARVHVRGHRAKVDARVHVRGHREKVGLEAPKGWRADGGRWAWVRMGPKAQSGGDAVAGCVVAAKSVVAKIWLWLLRTSCTDSMARVGGRGRGDRQEATVEAYIWEGDAAGRWCGQQWRAAAPAAPTGRMNAQCPMGVE